MSDKDIVIGDGMVCIVGARDDEFIYISFLKNLKPKKIGTKGSYKGKKLDLESSLLNIKCKNLDSLKALSATVLDAIEHEEKRRLGKNE